MHRRDHSMSIGWLRWPLTRGKVVDWRCCEDYVGFAIWNSKNQVAWQPLSPYAPSFAGSFQILYFGADFFQRPLENPQPPLFRPIKRPPIRI